MKKPASEEKKIACAKVIKLGRSVTFGRITKEAGVAGA